MEVGGSGRKGLNSLEPGRPESEESCVLEQVHSGLGRWGCHSWKEGSLVEEWVVVDAEFQAGAQRQPKM